MDDRRGTVDPVGARVGEQLHHGRVYSHPADSCPDRGGGQYLSGAEIRVGDRNVLLGPPRPHRAGAPPTGPATPRRAAPAPAGSTRMAQSLPDRTSDCQGDSLPGTRGRREAGPRRAMSRCGAVASQQFSPATRCRGQFKTAMESHVSAWGSERTEMGRRSAMGKRTRAFPDKRTEKAGLPSSTADG